MGRVERVAWLGPLLGRMTLGAVFVGTGLGKLNDLGNVTEFFGSLGIPAPGFNARLVATTELVGGIAVLLGLAARLASLPLAFTMVVAIITAKRGDIAGVRDLFALEEFTYLAILTWLAVAGPGAASLDRLMRRWWRRRSESASRAGRAGALPQPGREPA